MESNLHGHILVVDDNKLNRKLMLRLLKDLGHLVSQAENGVVALNILRDPQAEAVDVVLLDIMMPELDGYGLLEAIKGNEKLRNIPVIMTSALDELDSVVRCIEIGATDYLTKPVQPSLLKARLKSSLAEKRLRDLELEYLEQVGYVVSAAEAVETESYEPESLRHVAMRKDALGRLARVFQKMAQEVHLREQRLKQQLAQLQLDIEDMQKALSEKLEIYIPMDRRQAIYNETELPDFSTGAVLFADISDFTGLTNELAEEFGHPRGAEEITRLINQIFSALVEKVHGYRGSVINFTGDAITCWFDDHPIVNEVQDGTITDAAGARASACAMLMQTALQNLPYRVSGPKTKMDPGIKVAVVSGPAFRYLVGDPKIQYLEVLVGRPLEKLEKAEGLIKRGEVLVDFETFEQCAALFAIKEQRNSLDSDDRFFVIEDLKTLIAPTPWPDLPDRALDENICRNWIHPAVYRHALSNTRQYLSDLRPAAAVFVYFKGIDPLMDSHAGILLDGYIRWMQGVIDTQGGAILQLSFGDKGSYLYASFGAPVTQTEYAVRAVRAALLLLQKPGGFNSIFGEQIGISHGYMRTGTYGGDTRKTYGVIGSNTNLAARLMQAAQPGTILVDQETYEATANSFEFTTLPEITVKGRPAPIAVFSPVREIGREDRRQQLALNTLDRFTPTQQMLLKIASVIGQTFSRSILVHLLPVETEKENHERDVEHILSSGVIQVADDSDYLKFTQPGLQDAIYQSLLHAQRRHLHRQIALTMEELSMETPQDIYPQLAHHWRAAEEISRAVDYYDKAGKRAQELGDLVNASLFFKESLTLSSSGSVLRKDYMDR